ncbi:hypothetical protein CR162_14905 [Pseudoroseomonas rhizosphaerae]|uniref:Uncharacterized protein n=1 Tax=Teichococcus rhizosphaerae TaxID=1335062 RepID=A0A2C7ABN1_9PROT|nr:hypothetical protein [Pseudoroseomonas rhizosphaerae]PHK94057.1 hypothetical protein CR162_14905 [Pseudoroseomonas rhizosphaerae]
MFGSAPHHHGIDPDVAYGLMIGAGANARAANDLATASMRTTAVAMESMVGAVQLAKRLQAQVAQLQAQLAAERALTQALSAQHPESPILPLAGLIREAAGHA